MAQQIDYRIDNVLTTLWGTECESDGAARLGEDWDPILIAYSPALEREMVKVAKDSGLYSDLKEYVDRFNEIREEQWDEIRYGDRTELQTPIFCVNIDISEMGYDEYPSGWNYGLDMETYSGYATCEDYEPVGFNGVTVPDAKDLWKLIKADISEALEDIAGSKAKAQEDSYWEDVAEERASRYKGKHVTRYTSKNQSKNNSPNCGGN